jgi:N-methylhydantoinase A
VYFEETGFADTPIYERAALAPGATIDGPAIVEQMDTTIAIPPGARAQIDTYLNITIETQATANGNGNGAVAGHAAAQGA